jgi:FMN phosphatase YigB (HAD superfamily)
VLFVGNSYGHDIRPAIAAGWRTAWIRRPSDVPPSVKGLESKPEELPTGAPKPNMIVTDLRDLLQSRRPK